MAKGYSNYVDSMVDGKMSEAFTKAAGMDVRGTRELFPAQTSDQVWILKGQDLEYVPLF